MSRGRIRRGAGILSNTSPVHRPRHIHDPEGFEAAEAKALEASVEEVREVVEGAIGSWANNEYFEMHVDDLTPQQGNERTWRNRGHRRLLLGTADRPSRLTAGAAKTLSRLGEPTATSESSAPRLWCSV